MKKVGILTFHRAINYGAVLQAYALRDAIISLGFECEIIDYRCPKIENDYWENRIEDIGLLAIKKRLFYKLTDRKRLKFSKFYREYLNLHDVDRYFPENIRDSNKIYGIILVGSDQVWNYRGSNGDEAYFLDFAEDLKIKIAYSASFGIVDIPLEKTARYHELLSRFNSISVREKTGAEIVKKILDVNPDVTVDPTLLLTTEEWLEVTPRPIYKKYVLLYLLANSESAIEFARKIAKANNLTVIMITESYRSVDGIKSVRNTGPLDFLSLICNAEYVVTNSYHGVLFSLKYQRQFYVEYLANGNDVNTRFDTILELLDLKGRVLNKGAVVDNNTIDYDSINVALDNMKAMSLNYLKHAFGL